jgi:hypothetical protein
MRWTLKSNSDEKDLQKNHAWNVRLNRTKQINIPYVKCTNYSFSFSIIILLFAQLVM